ncbi:N-acetylmuramoyl-L-alanine amidase [Labilibaculum sp.]|uniref:N-acetylmuramoyl-L-alanine amidase n=1 Tax=Labilibaculum sp. TaxID=2060723 RepID=UPI002AA7DBF2|nr:N-acetylmuramoyl-L-alanine amidase [Labilibaculum sp.]
MRKLKYLVIHCTDTPAGRNVSADDIRRWHTDPKPKGRGWRQVGYQAMFHLNGEIEELVPNNNDSFVDSWEVTNGAFGFNSVSIHWVYVGGKGGDTRTTAQKKAMEVDVKAFHAQHPDVKIIGHHHLNAGKACPSFDVQAWLKEIGINQQLQ